MNGNIENNDNNNNNENNNNNNNKDKRSKSKKRAAIFLIVMGAALVLLLAVNFLPSLIESGEGSPSVTAAPAKTYPPEWFTVPDYDADLTADPDYMSVDRKMHYTVGNETFMIDGDASSYGVLCEFWEDYFAAAIAGDEDKLSEMYTDAYIKKFGALGKIAPQKICDIKVEQLSRTELTSGEYVGCFRSFFLVSYRILDNNGTFRNDFIEDNASVPLIYELIEDGDSVVINNYSREKAVSSSPSGSIPIVPILASAALVIALSVTVIIVITKKRAKRRSDMPTESIDNVR